MRLRRTLAMAILTLMVTSGGIQLYREVTGWPGDAESGLTAAPVALAEGDGVADAVAAALGQEGADVPIDPATAGDPATDADPATGAAPADQTPTDPGTAPSGDSTAATVPVATQPVIPQSGDGAIHLVGLPSGVDWTERSSGRVVRFAIGVEGGLGSLGEDFSRGVLETLGDPRGWQDVDGVRFQFVSASERSNGAAVDVTVVLASPNYTDRLCSPLKTEGQVSCQNHGRAVINVRRWALGVPWFGGDLQAYREYVVNHEVGHALGHGHATCLAPGAASPLMAQQTLGLKGCTPWPWPSRPTT